MNLSAAQWSAVRYNENALVLSVPGAGKTRIVQAKAIQEAAKVVDSPLRVACLTYTNAAADELRRRILPSLREAARDSVLIGTLHSFCIQEILAPHAGRLKELYRGHGVATPEHPLVERVIEELLGREPTDDDLRRFGEVSRRADGSASPHDELDAELIERYWEELLGRGLIDFAGVTYYSAILLERFPDVASATAASFPWFIVDEYQDTSTAQVRVLRAISVAGPVRWLLIGDFNQSIFGFNGASKDDLLNFAASLSAKRGIFKHSYRCPPAIVEQAVNLIAEPRMRSHNAVAPGGVYTVQGPFQHCVREYVKLLRDEGVAFHEAAIIAPFRWILTDPPIALSRLSVPVLWSAQFRMSGRTAVSNSVCSILAYAYHDDALHFLSAVAESRALFGPVGFRPMEGDVELAVLRVASRASSASLGSLSLRDVATVLLEELYVIVPVQVQARLSEAFDLALRPSLLRGSPLNRWMGEDLARVYCRHDGITLATIHGAKGLEFSAVLFLGFEDELIPFSKSDDYEEELRKAYVTVTRSSNLLMYAFRPGKRSALLEKALGEV